MPVYPGARTHSDFFLLLECVPISQNRKLKRIIRHRERISSEQKAAIRDTVGPSDQTKFIESE